MTDTALVDLAEKGEFYKDIERILDEHSAWIARPSSKVTEAVAFAAILAAHRVVDASDNAEIALLKAEIERLQASGGEGVALPRDAPQSDLQARVEQLEAVLKRLASSEAFVVARAVRPFEDQELIARMQYADTNLQLWPPGTTPPNYTVAETRGEANPPSSSRIQRYESLIRKAIPYVQNSAHGSYTRHEMTAELRAALSDTGKD